MFENLFKPNQQKDFWSWFKKHEQQYYNFENNQDALFDQLSAKLKSINEDLVFEFSPIRDNGVRELSISADGMKRSFSAVIDLIEKAPDFVNWQFYAFRQRVPGDGIKIKFGDGLEFSYDDIYFRYSEDEAEQKIGIELNIRNYDDTNKNIKSAAFILLDGLIGEYDMETRISWIDFVKLDEQHIDNLYPLTHLRDLVDLSKV
jgi:hypothetical protein